MPTDAGAGGESGSEDGSMAGAGGESDPGPPPPGDSCDDAVDVNEIADVGTDGTLVVRGTNVAARHDLTACDTSSAPLADVVYSYDVPATGGLRWTLDNVTPTRFLADVRSACDEVDSTLVCDECGVACGDELEVSAGDVLYFTIFGIRTTNSPEGTGSFELSLSLTPDPGIGEACVSPYAGGRPCPEGTACQQADGEDPTCGEPACGDGLLSFEPLECDDGNDVSGDGCSSQCTIDAQGPGGDTCETLTTLNLPGIRGILDDSVRPYGGGQGTFVAGSELDASCGDALGPEAVYVFELAEAGHVELVAENCEVLSVRAAGANDCGNDEIACESGLPDTAIVLALDLEPGRYSVILDRSDPTLATSDDYALTVMIDPPQ